MDSIGRRRFLALGAGTTGSFLLGQGLAARSNMVPLDQAEMAVYLQVIQTTTFKQSTADSSLLPDSDKVSVAAGSMFELHSWAATGQNTLKVSLAQDFLGNPPRNTWYVYTPHVQLVRPPQIKVIRNTVFKQSTVDSSQLPAQDKVAVSSGATFYLHSWAIAVNNHLKLALLSSLGNPPRNTWYAYRPDIQFIREQPEIIPPPSPPQPPPTSKNLNVPYYSQLDNFYNPTGTCNVTCFAMVMSYFQIRGTGTGRLADELYLYMQRNGLSRYDPMDLAKMADAYGLRDDFTLNGSLQDIRKAIAEGRPCIVHGYFTGFGHIIVLRGYDQSGFFVNDPYGEWFSSGYRNDLSGENLHYSNGLIQSKCSPEGDNFIWLHRLSKK